MKVPGPKIVPCQGVLGSNHSLTFGLFTQVSGLGPLGPLVLVYIISILLLRYDMARGIHEPLLSCSSLHVLVQQLPL